MPVIPLKLNETYQSKMLLPLVGTNDATDATTFNSNEKKNEREASEQEIRACGLSTVNSIDLSDAELIGYEDSLEAAKNRREGILVT